MENICSTSEAKELPKKLSQSFECAISYRRVPFDQGLWLKPRLQASRHTRHFHWNEGGLAKLVVSHSIMNNKSVQRRVSVTA